MKKREVCASRLPHGWRIGEPKSRTEVEYLQLHQTSKHSTEVGAVNLRQEPSHLLKNRKYRKSLQRLAGLSADLENIIGRIPPFVHTMATTSLFAQSKAQQLVYCNSIRSIGSALTKLVVPCVKNKRSERAPILTINWTLGVWRLEVSWMRDNKHGKRPILESSSK